MLAGDDDYYRRDNSDYRFEIFKSSGPGGQNRNKVSSGVKCIHIPTGIKQERTAKCQHTNKKNALDAVNRLLDEHILNTATQQVQNQRISNIGSGERGTKMRVYKFQQGLVIDNKSGKRISIKQCFKGNINKLWK